MKKQYIFIALIGLAGILFAAGKIQNSTSCIDARQGEIKINTQTFQIEYARTPEEQTKGLAGCTQLPEKGGMYFPYNTPRQAAFWMKGMLMPIDIIWIADKKVIGIEENVQPQTAAQDSELTLYRSPQPIDAVLELAAGSAQQYNIQPGDNITATTAE